MVSKSHKIVQEEYLKGIKIPPGADPFDYIAKVIKWRLSLPFSKSTIVILFILLIFHSLVVIFCLFILVMSISGRKKTRWLVRTFYIRDESGGAVYSSPLYFINVAIFMTVAQMLCSASAQAYIWIELSGAWSTNYVQHSLITIPLGVMNISETLCYWSVIHCFMVTVFLSRGSRGANKGLMRWISPTRLINIFFICTPLAIGVAAAGLFTWEGITENRVISASFVLMAHLKQASSAWRKLQNQSLSIDQKNIVSVQLLRTVSALKKIGEDMGGLLGSLIYSIKISQAVLASFASFTCIIFMLMFYMLVCEYWRGRKPSTTYVSTRVDHFPNWINREKFENSDSSQSTNGNLGGVSILMLNKQFFYVLLRAFGVFLSMISKITALLIISIKAHDFILQQYWRGVSMWLGLVSGTWAALPIAWQCWQLYVEQARTRLPIDSQTGTMTSQNIPDGGLDPFSPCEIQLPELTHCKFDSNDLA